MFVKCDDNAGREYITAGKVYAAKKDREFPHELATIIADDRAKLLIRITACAHLDLMPWTVCDAEGISL